MVYSNYIARAIYFIFALQAFQSLPMKLFKELGSFNRVTIPAVMQFGMAQSPTISRAQENVVAKAIACYTSIFFTFLFR